VTTATERVRSAFIDVYGEEPTVAWSAPGRVNLIGEHTDYNDGFVLPFALPSRTAVAGRVAAGRPEWTIWSESTGRVVKFGGADLSPGSVTGWAAYAAGVVWSLREAGVSVPPTRLAITSDVPVGAGLSSSAALECAVLAALLDLTGVTVPMLEWPGLARRAENGYVGVPCGIMDQTAATFGRAGHALFLDCRSLAIEQVPFDLTTTGLAMVTIDTRAPHRLVSGEYADRRATCEEAARALGVRALRDVADAAAALDALADDVSRRRVRHVVTENERVHRTVDLLRAGRPAEIGPLLSASHASLRDDFEVTVSELDVAAEAAESAGALGARMTGGGFGGCVIALVDVGLVDHVIDAVAKAFAVRGFRPPDAFVTEPAAGVGPIVLPPAVATPSFDTTPP
jgi:galactokinase